MWRLLHYLFGWDYIAWKEIGSEGISRVHHGHNGKPWYFRFTTLDVVDEIEDPNQVVWLTCSSDKYMECQNSGKNVITDKFGNEFTLGAVVKLDHYTGKHNRKFYMHKVVVKICKDEVWFAHITNLRLDHKVTADFRLSREECKNTQIVEAYYSDLRVLKIAKRRNDK